MSAAAVTQVAGHAPGLDRTWRHALLALTIVVMVVLMIYRGTAAGIVDIWLRSETFTHCFLIAPITLWLIWRRRDVLARQKPSPSLSVLPVIALTGMAWLIGQLGAINALIQFSLVGLLVLAVPAVLGFRVAMMIAFPLAFLFFMVPFGEFVMPQMMEMTADFTVFALRISGIPVYREGLQFIVPSGNWSVVEACSGVRYLIASFTVGTVFAYLNYRSMRKRAVFMIVSLLVPVVANWLRAYLIVMLGHLSSNRLAVGVDHLIYGWLFFGLVIMIMFAIGARWSEDESDQVPSIPATAANESSREIAKASFYLVAAVMALLVAAPQLAESRIVAAETSGSVKLVRPDTPKGWISGGALLSDLRPEFENPSAEQHLAHRQGETAIGVYLAYFRHQGLGRKMISSQSVLVSSENTRWAQVSSVSRDVIIGTSPLHFKAMELRGGNLQGISTDALWTAWQIYWIDGHWTSSAALAKALTVRSRILGRGDDSAVVVIYTRRLAGDSSAALERHIVEALPLIEKALEATRAIR